MGFVSNIIGGIMGANAAGNASNAEVQGAQAAQKTIEQNQKDANAAQQTALGNVTAAEQPYQALGSTAAGNLNALLAKGFTPPNPNDVASTPEYQFAQSQGIDTINKDAAANGTLLSGNTGVALQKFGQGLASQTYQQSYQDAINAFLANSGALQSGVNSGLTSTGQLTGANLTTAGNTANIDLTSGQEVAQQQNNAAAARAQGILGKAAGWSSAIGGAAGGIGNIDFSGGSSPLEMAGEFAGLL